MVPTTGQGSDMGLDDEQRHFDAALKALVDEFAGRLSQEEVSARFAEIVRVFEAAPIRGFVPVLAQRRTREQLRQTAGG